MQANCRNSIKYPYNQSNPPLYISPHSSKTRDNTTGGSPEQQKMPDMNKLAGPALHQCIATL